MSGWNFPLFPDRAATHAGQVDAIYIFLLTLCGMVALAIAFTIAFFAVRYRRTRHAAEQIEGSTMLEVTWTVIPLMIFMFIFVWGANVYFDAYRSPRDAEEVYTVAKQWMWKFQHLDGQREINQLHVPVGRDIRMTMISQDVIHSFFVPAFRIKGDVLPGRYSHVWFHATKPGTYHLFCAEYCGTQHSGMIGQVIVMSPADYEQWLAGGAAAGSLAQNGEKLFMELGCNTCHRADSGARGPNLVGLFGSSVHLADGRTITADESYIRESILNPSAKVVAGFQPIMPNFQAQVNEEGVLALVAYVKSLRGGAVAAGQPIPNRPAPANAPPAGEKVK
jgi:cytochrome c oxidase subunit II